MDVYYGHVMIAFLSSSLLDFQDTCSSAVLSVTLANQQGNSLFPQMEDHHFLMIRDSQKKDDFIISSSIVETRIYDRCSA